MRKIVKVTSLFILILSGCSQKKPAELGHNDTIPLSFSVLPLLTFNQDITFEYGITYSSSQLEQIIINKDASMYDTLNLPPIDTSIVTSTGVYKTGFKKEATSKRNQTIVATRGNKQMSFEFEYYVLDQVIPVIKGSDTYETSVNTSIDFSSKITAIDMIDGPLPVTFTGNVDYSKKGIYEITAHTEDSNQNKITRIFQVSVK